VIGGPQHRGAEPLPELDGVGHRFIDLAEGVTIHVAEAGPPDGPTVMLVHGFPQNWWQWHRLIGPLAADGYHVLCPDLRGAGWSSTPRDRYMKTDMADDLAAVLGQLSTGAARLVAHDWGGPVAFLLVLRHPDKVSGIMGFNTSGPWYTLDWALLRGLWRLWYQLPIALPIFGPCIIGDARGRFLRLLCRWLGAGFVPPELPLYVRVMATHGHADAGSRWYRTAQLFEIPQWICGRYDTCRIDMPVRMLHGTRDPVITATLLRGYEQRMCDFEMETVDDAGHWIVEQQWELVLNRLKAFLAGSSPS
jgi:pimeloyl-ACP methyl ester carboxylesterase